MRTLSVKRCVLKILDEFDMIGLLFTSAFYYVTCKYYKKKMFLRMSPS